MLRVYLLIAIFSLCLTFCGGGPAEAPESDAPAEITFTGDVPKDLETVDKVVKTGPFAASWSSLEENGIPEWYQDAKLGIFIHWGVYAVPAYGNEWYPRRMYLDEEDPRRGVNPFQHHLKTWGPQKTFGYKDFVPMFKAENFNPDDWAALLEESGAKYIVPVGEHHDGFSMYANSYTRWDASERGPKRDVIAGLEKSVRARGLKFGVSSHRAFNWGYYPRDENFDTVDVENFDLYGKPRPDLYHPKDHRGWPPQDQEFKDDWLARTAELAEKFKADLIWFDFGISPEWRAGSAEQNPYAPELQQFAAFYYNRAKAWGKTGIINYKHKAFTEKSAVLDLERARLSGMREPFWQTDTSVSFSSWGYVTNQRYKDVGLILTEFVDIVSKNGCLLLNIGPKADGTIPEKEAEMLREIGGWLKVNGEAIYGSRTWKTWGEGPTETVEGHLSEQRNKRLTAEDIRYTTKGDQLYAIALGWSGNGWKMPSLASGSEHLAGKKVTSVELLGGGPSEFTQGADALVVKAPSQKPNEYAYVFKIGLE